MIKNSLNEMERPRRPCRLPWPAMAWSGRAARHVRQRRVGEGCEAGAEHGRQGRCPARGEIHQNQHALGRRDTGFAAEQPLTEGEGRAAESFHDRADLDAIAPMDLGAKIERQADDDELAAGWGKGGVFAVEQADPAAFAKGREHRVVDVALAVGIAVAGTLLAPMGETAAQGERCGSIHAGRASLAVVVIVAFYSTRGNHRRLPPFSHQAALDRSGRRWQHRLRGQNRGEGMSVGSERVGTAAEQARILAHALPFLRRYAGATIVVKYGGHAMGEEALAAGFGRDIALLKQVGVNPVVVHGGGPQINAMLKRLAIQSSFVDGLRVTDAAMVEVVEMVLAGTVNKQVAGLINAAGALAVGISGKDGGLIRARKLTRTRRDPGSHIEQALDLGFVGEPERIDVRVVHALTGAGLIPVIAPVGLGADGQTYNINADTVAGAIAAALGATRLLMLTDVPGVLDAEKRPIAELDVAASAAAIRDGTISGGMIPKVETCLAAVKGGVQGAVILDGRVPHACLLELFTEGGIGTLIRA